MKLYRAACVFVLLGISFARAGTEAVNRHLGGASELVAPSFEVAAETAYLWGAIGNANSYEIGTQFITARWRWGVNPHEGFFRGYNQVYLLAMGEAIFRGPENRYFGISTGFRYNFVQRGWPVVPYISGGVGLGWIDSHANIPGAQGQDFTFNILTAVGISYQISDRWKVQLGGLYQHFSNAGQTQPNSSLNAFGPQIGLTHSF